MGSACLLYSAKACTWLAAVISKVLMQLAMMQASLKVANVMPPKSHASRSQGIKMSLQGAAPHLCMGNASMPHDYTTNNKGSAPLSSNQAPSQNRPLQEHSRCSDMQPPSLHAASSATNSSKACNMHLQHMQ